MTMKFTDEHEWVLLEGDIATVGITKFAADALGDVSYVEMPALGVSFTKGDDMAVVDSIKASSSIYAPISGEITAVNTVIMDEAEDGEGKPEVVNEAPTAEGWFCKLKVKDVGELDDLMDADAYAKFCEGL